MAGAPKGNKNSSRANRLWGETIRRLCVQQDAATLRALAQRLLDRALEGDIAALRELGDRLDGRPAQAITGDDGGPLRIEVVRFGAREPEE